jgi:hypothetical protein
MNNLQEKSKEPLSTSWLTHPVTGRTAVPSSSIDGRRDTKPFWLAEDFLCGDTEPLPSMFRSKEKISGTERRLASVDIVTTVLPADRLSKWPISNSAAAVENMLRWAARPYKWHISNRTASYIIASCLLVFAAVDGVLLTASTFSADRKGRVESASAALDQDGTETAMVFLTPSSESAEASPAPLLAPAHGALPEGKLWPAALDALEQLTAQRKASQAAVMKQAENERLLERLEAWMNARTQKPAAVAGACAGPAPQCWKSATRIQ